MNITLIVATVLATAAITYTITHTLLRNRYNPNTSTPRTAPTPKPETETYGHPSPPVVAIRRLLPKLQHPYAWESWIDTTPTASTFTINLVNIIESNTLATREVNLAPPELLSRYRRYSIIRNDIMRGDFTEPVIRWATREAERHCNYQPERTGYKLG